MLQNSGSWDLVVSEWSEGGCVTLVDIWILSCTHFLNCTGGILHLAHETYLFEMKM